MKQTTRSAYFETIQQTTVELQKRLDDPPSLDKLADQACLSPFYFHRLFRGMVGEAPGELVRRLRMERAALDLLESEESVSDIAYRAGFVSHEGFTRAFRDVFGNAPSEWRGGATDHLIPSANGIHFYRSGPVYTFMPMDTGGKNMKVEIVEIGDQKVLCYPHRGPYNQIGEAFGKLYQYAGPRGLIQGNGYGIYYDDPEGKDPAELRSDACVAIKDDVVVEPPLEVKTLKGGKFGKYLHVGPYSKLGEAWDKLLGEYVPTYGLKFDNSRVAFEKYINDMNSTPEEKLETEIFVPVL